MEKERRYSQKIPQLYSIHKATVKKIQSYGAFVGIKGHKDALLHIYRIATSRIETVDEVLSVGEKIFRKVVEADEDSGKVGVDIRFVGQRDGEDKDPNNVSLTQHGKGGKGIGKGKGDPIELDVWQVWRPGAFREGMLEFRGETVRHAGSRPTRWQS